MEFDLQDGFLLTKGRTASDRSSSTFLTSIQLRGVLLTETRETLYPVGGEALRQTVNYCDTDEL